ncbi:hypothetical protein BKA56DRAFT_363090 [Ilyonectria sp. MPI-CAGE-AT-0026]|nr:hypothetical protein BKA56DRAFT_363090 [Ilyonectria sp. MPI-CAGE-AT-0026]
MRFGGWGNKVSKLFHLLPSLPEVFPILLKPQPVSPGFTEGRTYTGPPPLPQIKPHHGPSSELHPGTLSGGSRAPVPLTVGGRRWKPAVGGTL